ncbi:MAG: 2-C-methyl-D-erythritol 4-phosphate cytidylyltransferase, partial [Bacteroidales bacterium]|nr:2-C-methyl-D-erythritol 4-phosphate cytidylyltransferase [Bacteroidales bacterium]
VKKYCIIVAGGSGRRMNSAIPKQFLLLDGRPLLMHTVERFHSFDRSIELIIVLPPEHHALWDSLVREYSFSISHIVAAGGEERFHSVRAGLAVVRAGTVVMTPDAMQADTGDDSLVAIHDGVRPLVSHDTIWRCYADAEEFGSAVPFVEPADSVRVLQGDDSAPMPRHEVRLIQTPQVFHGSLILKAYEHNFDPLFTDDATVAEASGVKIHLTHGNRENIKITTPEDLAVAHTLTRMLRQ